MIQPKLKATNMDLSNALREYIETKLEAVDKLLPQDEDAYAFCEVEIERTTTHHQTGDIYRAEFNLTVQGNYHRSEATEADMYAAIDKAKDDLVEEIRRSKGKKRALIRKGGAKIKEMLRRLSF